MMTVVRRAPAMIVLAVLGGAARGCGPADGFACASDEQCQADGAVGACQVNGYCSFPDESCPSGQRFGDAAPAGVAGMCVEPSTSTGTGSETTGASLDDDAAGDDKPDWPALETADEGASTGAGLDESTSGGPPTTGASTNDTTTGELSRCAWEPVDDFDDGMLDAMWSVSADPGAGVQEVDGGLEVALPASTAWIAGGVTMDLPPMSGGWARVRVTEIVSPALLVTVGLNLGNGTCAFQLYISQSAIRAHLWNADEGAGTQLAYETRWQLPVWLQLRQDDTGVLHFEWSEDEVSWQELASGTFDECGDIEVPLTLLLGSGGQAAQGSVRSIDAFAACVP